MLMLPPHAALACLTALPMIAMPSAANALWPCAATGLAGLCGGLYIMLHRAQQEISSTKDNRAVLERLHGARDKHVAEQMEAVKADLRQAKVDIGVQRKKTHAAQQALQAAQKALREESRRREAAQNERPAFLEVKPKGAPTRAAQKPAADAAVPAAEVAKPADAAFVQAAETAPSADFLVAQAQLETLKRQHAALTDALRQAQQAGQVQKQQAQRLQRRHEDLRRIDIISRSKVELLEDKLRGMGRQYYEAISELALLKGEVAPPKPPRVPKAPCVSTGDPMTPEMIDPAQHAKRPALAMMAAEGDEDDDEDNDSANAPTILDDLDSEGESDDGLPIPSDFSSPNQPQA